MWTNWFTTVLDIEREFSGYQLAWRRSWIEIVLISRYRILNRSYKCVDSKYLITVKILTSSRSAACGNVGFRNRWDRVWKSSRNHQVFASQFEVHFVSRNSLRDSSGWWLEIPGKLCETQTSSSDKIRRDVIVLKVAFSCSFVSFA